MTAAPSVAEELFATAFPPAAKGVNSVKCYDAMAYLARSRQLLSAQQLC